MYKKRDNVLEVLNLYRGNYKKGLYLGEINKLSGLNLKTTQNALEFLENSGILKSNIRGKNKYFYLNLNNIQTKLFLLQAEIYKTHLFLNKYPQFKIFLNDLKDTFPLIVFGSFSKFKADKNSDIDLLVLSKNKPKLSLHFLSNKVHLLSFSEEDFVNSLNKSETLIDEILENHIILNDFSFFVNLVWEHYGRQRN